MMTNVIDSELGVPLVHNAALNWTKQIQMYFIGIVSLSNRGLGHIQITAIRASRIFIEYYLLEFSFRVNKQKTHRKWFGYRLVGLRAFGQIVWKMAVMLLHFTQQPCPSFSWQWWVDVRRTQFSQISIILANFRLLLCRTDCLHAVRRWIIAIVYTTVRDRYTK